MFNITIGQKEGALQTIMRQIPQNMDDKEQARMTTCMLLTATHRAYEMSFNRLTLAWKIYAQSYMRDTRRISGRNVPYPCTLFYSMQNGAHADGFCKKPVFTTSSGQHVTGHGIALNRKYVDMGNIE